MIRLAEKDEATSTGVIASSLNQSGWADAKHGAHPYVENWFVSPIFKKGKALQFVPQRMQVSRPYPFQFIDWWFVAIKRNDGSIDFFHVD